MVTAIAAIATSCDLCIGSDSCLSTTKKAVIQFTENLRFNLDLAGDNGGPSVPLLELRLSEG